MSDKETLEGSKVLAILDQCSNDEIGTILLACIMWFGRRIRGDYSNG